jgi:hypothetical protein
MKIGILTFHSQLNYGGVLQCWALQAALENMGHEVIVIDREFEHQIRSYKRIFRGWGVDGWIKFLIKLLLIRPGALRVIRYIRTVQFVRTHLHLSDYSFKNWCEAPSDLGVGLIVVGSDQVWNGVWNDLDVYTLKGAPDVPAIGYAISLGMNELPQGHLADYKRAVGRFMALSVREKEAQHLLEQVGAEVKHVADPTLLVAWNGFRVSESAGLVCYLIRHKDLTSAALRQLKDFAKVNKMRVHILLQNYAIRIPPSRKIAVHYCAGPQDFCQLIAAAKYVVSDSFHALMFSCVFEKNVRILHPKEAERSAMFSRIKEFADNYIVGDCVSESIGDAIESFLNNGKTSVARERLDAFVSESKAWLRDFVRAPREKVVHSGRNGTGGECR